MERINSVWITGAGSGIGKALAIKFAGNNLKVIGSARRIEPVEKLNGNLTGSPLITAYKCDVSKYEEVEQTALKIQDKYNINCLINNAGISSFKPFVENDISEIQNIIETNLLGAIYTTKLVLPEMIKTNSGTIINILSVAAKTVFTNSSVYSASKAGLENFAKVLREEVRSYNIRIINIFPGATSTEIWPKQSLEKFSHKMMTPEKLADVIFDIYNYDLQLSPEEFVIRPILGDL